MDQYRHCVRQHLSGNIIHMENFTGSSIVQVREEMYASTKWANKRRSLCDCCNNFCIK